MKVPERVLPFVKQLRYALQETGLTFKEIERRAGMADRYASKLLNGHVRLTVEHTFRLLDAAGSNPEDFFRQIAVRYRPAPKALTEEQHRELLARALPEFESLLQQLLDERQAREEEE